MSGDVALCSGSRRTESGAAARLGLAAWGQSARRGCLAAALAPRVQSWRWRCSALSQAALQILCEASPRAPPHPSNRRMDACFFNSRVFIDLPSGVSLQRELVIRRAKEPFCIDSLRQHAIEPIAAGS